MIEPAAGPDTASLLDAETDPGISKEGEEIPVPLGFDSESWREYLEEKWDSGTKVEVGGIEVAVAEMESPLFYDGEYPRAELVSTSSKDLDRLGVSPGDELPGSTDMNSRIYVRAPEYEEAAPGDQDLVPLGSGPTLGVNPDMWDGRTGAGLAFGRNSYIEISGCSDRELMPFWNPYRWGEACFSSYYTGHSECVEALMPHVPCNTTNSNEVTSWYAKLFTFYVPTMVVTPDGPEIEVIEYFIWLVYKPQVWKDLGEDGWDDIRLRADKDAAGEPVMIHGVQIKHNGKIITGGGWSPDPFELNAPPDEMDLSGQISGFKNSLVFGLASAPGASPILARAIEDYAQAASKKYPVYSDNGSFPFPYQNLTAPVKWCSEFASWPIRQGAIDAGHQGFFGPDLPQANDQDMDLAVLDFYDWGSSWDSGDRLLFFGENTYPAGPGYDWNGATDAEWAALAEGVTPGDYVSRWHEREADGGTIGTSGHSMIFVGWLADDGSGVGPQHFDTGRVCNRLVAVGGNEQAYGWDNTGLGGVVNVSTRVVCKEPLTIGGVPQIGSSGFYEDPTCTIDSQPYPCEIRLYDTRPFTQNSNQTRAAFFVDTELP
ncbi:MAG: hypothetical protein R6V85_01260 [Polyangia bacterium]